MDYSIAIIIPSTLVCNTTRKTLKKLGLDYPVYEGSSEEAVRIAKKIIPQGVKMIISHGLTYEYLQRDVSVPLMELPFSGLDAAIAVKEALLHSDKIVHVGTPHLFHFLQRSLKFLGIDKNCVSFCELDLGRSVEAQTQDMIDLGYEVIIGGFPAVNHALKHGKYGIEFDVDELIIEATIQNAQTMVANMIEWEKKNELDKVILQATSDGIIAIDEKRKICSVNHAAEKIIKKTMSNLNGLIFEVVLQENNIIDVESLTGYGEKLPPNTTPVVLNEIPVMVHNEQKFSVVSIKKVSEIQELEYQIRKDLILKGLIAKSTFDSIVGESKILKDVKVRAKMYARYDSTILISGETGTGKELFAQSIHNESKRSKQPFVAINCATLPENLIESELFGYIKGAFTGANKEGKMGLFEIANNGTLFLDEISELPVSMQSKLLRVIQEGEIIRIGGDKVIHVNTRVICSSNKDLLQLIKIGQFKDDLYYRLCVLEIEIPPLRAHKEDIEYLSYALLNDFNIRHGKNVSSISPDVLEVLMGMKFMGNVRELKNIIERMMILANDTVINMEVLVQSGIKGISYKNIPESEPICDLKAIEYDTILEALKKCENNKAATARMLGIDPSTLWRKMKSYGLK